MVCVSLKCKNENFTEKFVNQKLNKFHFYCNAVYIIFGKIKYNNFFLGGGGNIIPFGIYYYSPFGQYWPQPNINCLIFSLTI